MPKRSMEDIYDELKSSGSGIDAEFTQQQFYTSAFKAAMVQKIKTFRANQGISGQGGPRLAPLRGESTKKFFGICLRA